jgi:hypothetical protein
VGNNLQEWLAVLIKPIMECFRQSGRASRQDLVFSNNGRSIDDHSCADALAKLSRLARSLTRNGTLNASRCLYSSFSECGIRKSARYFGSSHDFTQGAAALSKACMNALFSLPESRVRARKV